MAFLSHIRFLLSQAAVRSIFPTRSFLLRGAQCQVLMPVTACWRESSSIAGWGVGSTKPRQDITGTDTRVVVEFGPLYESLSNRLKDNKFVKATDVNILWYNTNSLEQLEKAKQVMALFRISPSFSRDSQPSVVVSACLKLNAPQQALEMLTDSVKYGLFPSRRCLCKVLYSFSFSHNLEGVGNTVQLMRTRELPVTGYELLLVLKAHMSEFVRQYTDKTMLATETTSRDDATPTADITPTIEDLMPILKLCEDCRKASTDQGSLSYYFMNGKLLANKNLVPLSAQLLDKIEQERKLPEKLILNLRLDYVLQTGNLPGIVDVLNKLKKAGIELSHRRAPRLRSIFDDCQDAKLVQSFKNLKLDEMLTPLPPARASRPSLQKHVEV